MGVTPRGFRFMNATDLLATIHTRTKNLAEDVDNKVGLLKSGQVTVTGLATGVPSSTNGTLVFSDGGFPDVPIVTATAFGTANPQNFDVSVSAATTTQCTVTVTRRAGANTALPVNIHAHY